MTRMLHLGQPGAQTRKLYKAVLEAQLAAIAAVRAGIQAGHVDRAARKVLKAHGFEKEFVHSTGHGLGLEIHEDPDSASGTALFFRPGWRSRSNLARILRAPAESVSKILCRDRDGCEILTPTPRNWLFKIAFNVTMTVDEIKELIQVVNDSGIAELEVQRGENRVRIRRRLRPRPRSLCYRQLRVIAPAAPCSSRRRSSSLRPQAAAQRPRSATGKWNAICQVAYSRARTTKPPRLARRHS